MVDAITQVNQKVFGGFSAGSLGSAALQFGFWAVLALLVIGIPVIYWYYLTQKKAYSRKVTDCELVGGYYEPTYTDVAKIVKIGRGGFEVLQLKKAKTWRLAYGGRVGKDKYYFFKDNAGYYHNGRLCGNVSEIDKSGGLIPIVTTDPYMRGQHTALQKQIDSLHKQAESFWDKYGNWMLSLAFVLIIGILAYLIYGKISTFMTQSAEVTKQQAELIAQTTKLIINLKGNSPIASGLVAG